jgi:hypothetical protein
MGAVLELWRTPTAVALTVIRVCFTLGASWRCLHPYVGGGMKRNANISIVGTRTEPECHRR